jgi:hypothetical protein
MLSANLQKAGDNGGATEQLHQPLLNGQASLQPHRHQLGTGGVPCPRAFWLTQIAARVLSPSAVVPVLGLLCLTYGVLEAGMTAPYAGSDDDNPSDSWFNYEFLPGGKIAWKDKGSNHHYGKHRFGPSPSYLGILSSCFTALALPPTALILKSLRGVLHPGGGEDEMQRLGAGSRQVHQVGLQCVMRRCPCAAIRCWAAIGFLVAALLWMQQVYVKGPRIFTCWGGRSRSCDFAWAMWTISETVYFIVTVPLAIAWILTLKISAALVIFRVHTIQQGVRCFRVSSSEWHECVEQEVSALATVVLPLLSERWAGGAMAVVILCWCTAFANFLTGLNSSTNSALQGFNGGMDSEMASYGSAFGYACIPAIVLWDMASATSEVQLLVESLAMKRAAEPDDTTHLAIQKLELILGRINGGQGAGFVLFGVVISKGFLYLSLFKGAALFSTGSTTLYALRDSNRHADGSNSCNITPDQQKTIDDMLKSFANDACTIGIINETWCLRPN